MIPAALTKLTLAVRTATTALKDRFFNMSLSRILSLLACVVCTSTAFGDDKEKLEAEVYNRIADNIVERDQLLKRFAVVRFSESVHIRSADADPFIYSHIDLRVVDKASKIELRGSFQIVDSDSESGAFVGQFGDRMIGWDNSRLFKDDGVVKTDKQSLKSFRNRFQAWGYDPIDDIFATPYGWQRGGEGFTEIFALGKFDFESAKRGLNGDLIAEF